jgi:exodeoxyribonuclease-3
VRVATWNVNSLKARRERVESWLGRVEPDVVCLQETKLADDAFPDLTFRALGYETAHVGQGRWNGVAIMSRVGLDAVEIGFGDGNEDEQEARLVWATCGGVRVGSVYVPNGRAVGHEQFDYKLAFLRRLGGTVEVALAADEPLVVAGDFNVAPDDRDVWDPAAFVDSTHVSADERAALAELEACGLRDLFRDVYDDGGLFSWWDYRAGNFHKGRGMRIDLVLGSDSVAASLRSILIDRNERKGPSPSDHAPVVADLALG